MKYKISHINGKRQADELVIYNCEGKTGTNAYGLEAIVENGIVTKIGSNDNSVPSDGYVISGHGEGSKIVESLCEGAKIEFDSEKSEITVTIDNESYIYRAKNNLQSVKIRFEGLIASGESFDVEKAFDTINQAEAAIEAGNVKNAEELLENAYYLTATCRENEIRAIWHRPHEKTAAQVDATVKRLKEAGFNMLLVETNYEGFANAKKTVYEWLPLRKGLEDTDCDIIEEFIKAGKKYGVEIHAWLEDFFFGVKEIPCKMLELHPELCAITKSGDRYMDGWDSFVFLNPALDEVHNLLENMYRDLLDNYDFDGIQLDYIRYPLIKNIERSAGFEEQTKKMFRDDTGIDIDKVDSEKREEWKKFLSWRADKITKYVSRIVNMVREYNEKGRSIKLSTAVFGDPDEAIRLKCQNWLYWVKQNWLDYIFPMAYLNDASDVGREIKYMVENYGEAPNISGISPMYNHLPPIEATKQVEECRKAGAAGIAFFETKALTDSQIEKLKIGVFRK